MSLFKKIKTISKTGFDPYLEGKKNYNRNNAEIEALAKRRAEICVNCKLYSHEPIKSLRIDDKRISTLHHKMCGDCGCSLPYLLRQQSKICQKWLENTNTSAKI